MITRRNFLRGASASLIAAPAIVSIANIMPVRSLYKPHEVEFWVKGLKEITETNPGSRLDAPYYAEFDTSGPSVAELYNHTFEYLTCKDNVFTLG